MTEPANTTMPKASNRTGPQISAAAPEASVWVSANAGTGKTRVLVDRISRLLLGGVAPERILCLTFTKAAAAEMANRLSALLSGWSAMGDEVLTLELRALGERDIDAALLTRAKQLFALTLEAPEGLRIRTIHSFCESLLGRFPLEAGIAPDFRVMDERDQRETQLDARDHMLNEAEAQGTALTDALAAIAGMVDEDGFASLIRELDGNRAKFRHALAVHGGADTLCDAVYRALGIAPGQTADDVIRQACDVNADDVAILERLCAAWDHGAPGNVTFATTVRAWLAMSVEARMLGWRNDIVKIFVTEKAEVRSEKRLVTKDADAFDPGAQALAVAYGGRLIETLDTLKAIDAAFSTQALIRIGAALNASYEDIKRHRGRLDYDDLIERASGLLNSPSGVSWVHYKLDGGIEHVLVDEAQDTSPEQWRVIEEVASDFFSGQSRFEETAEGPRTVFAVGDEKQSIYSFQGADPRKFGEMRAAFEDRVSGAGRVWLPVAMAESFRSAPAVLKVVDKVFENEDAARGLSFNDAKVRHVSARTGQAGAVELWPLEEPTEDDAKDEPWDAPLDHISANSAINRVVIRIADTIKGWLDKGEVLPAQGRPIKPGDILILLQKRKGVAEAMTAALKDRGVPVSGRDRMNLVDQLAVQDLIALGRLALLPEDDLNTATVLKGPLVGLSETDLYNVAYDRGDGVRLITALSRLRDTTPAYKAAWDKIATWRGRADFMPPFEFFAEALNGEGGRVALIRDLGPDAADTIDEFLSAALDFERDHVPSMEGFLHWLETGTTEVKRDLEQGRDEVRVMTVHGAKGLQAEIVFLADAGSVPASQNEDKIRWFEDDGVPVWPGHAGNETASLAALKEARRNATLEEYRRLLYVALTRAKDRLYVAGYTTKQAPKDLSWHGMVSGAMAEIGTTVDEADGRSRLVYAEPQTADAPDGDGGIAAAESTGATLPDWAKVPPGPEPLPSTPLSPSRPDGTEPPVRSPLGGDNGQRFKRGLVVHALMQTLPELDPGARRQACQAFVARPVHGFDADAQAALTDEVMAVMENPALSAAFGPGARAEVPIAGVIDTQQGPRAVSGQIDRLVVTPDAVLIIDFKTNRPSPDRTEDVSETYLRQMATYRAALSGIFPSLPVRAILLWTDGPKWMELPDNMLAAHAP